jgi:hypothetical protein
MQSNRGGKREGAGRKPAPDGTQKVPYATKLTPTVVQYLRSRENAAQAIETAIERSKDFRKWNKQAKLDD